MRIGIIAIQHESNTFLSAATTLEDFAVDTLLTGEALREHFRQTHHEVGGFLTGLREAGTEFEAVPLLAAVAVPSGIITAEAEAALVQMMQEQLCAAGKLDGLLVAPHGAAVSAAHADMDGYWLQLLREQFGQDKPIVCTLDLHANVSQAMIDACDATIAYRSNPHLDQHARGQEAARLMARTLRGEIKPTQAVARPPIAINIERQQTQASPCRELYRIADQMLMQAGVLGNSDVLGFPYADVVEMGASCIVVTDNNPGLAGQLADRLADTLWRRREEFVAELIGIEQALQMAAAHSGPSCLLDMGDNVGGGSAADGTCLAHALHRSGRFKAFVSLYDPQAVAQVTRCGAGDSLKLSMGGKTDALHGEPLTAEVTVTGLFDGHFQESDPRHGGRSDYQMGPTALVTTESGLTIQLTSLRVPPFSLGQLLSCGVDPAAFDILVAKGVVAPVAAYQSVCSQFIRVNTPGSTTADMLTLPYRHRRRPLFPFEAVD